MTDDERRAFADKALARAPWAVGSIFIVPIATTVAGSFLPAARRHVLASSMLLLHRAGKPGR